MECLNYLNYSVDLLVFMVFSSSITLGGTFVLRREVKELKKNKLLTSEGNVVEYEYFYDGEMEVMKETKNEITLEKEKKANQLKSIIITSCSLFDLIPQQDLEDDKKEEFENSMLMGVIPPSDTLNTIYILQLNYTTQCCVKGKYLIHISMEMSEETKEEEFQKRIEELNMNMEYQLTYKHYLKNTNITMEESMEEAEKIFKKLFPLEEFLSFIPGLYIIFSLYRSKYGNH
jgi:hypothetical protein